MEWFGEINKHWTGTIIRLFYLDHHGWAWLEGVRLNSASSDRVDRNGCSRRKRHRVPGRRGALLTNLQAPSRVKLMEVGEQFSFVKNPAFQLALFI